MKDNNPYQDLLTMIENVSPDDIGQLDEIDARVWILIKGYFFKGRNDFMSDNHGGLYLNYTRKDTKTMYPQSFKVGETGKLRPQYTRSRDALKAIRPEGGKFLLKKIQYGLVLWNMDRGGCRGIPICCRRFTNRRTRRASCYNSSNPMGER